MPTNEQTNKQKNKPGHKSGAAAHIQTNKQTCAWVSQLKTKANHHKSEASRAAGGID